MIFGVPIINLVYLGGFLFDKAETAFKYVYLFVLLITGIEFIICIPRKDFFNVIMYTNPVVSVFYCIFTIMAPRSHGALISRNDGHKIWALQLSMLAQGAVLFVITVCIDMYLMNRFKGADGAR